MNYDWYEALEADVRNRVLQLKAPDVNIAPRINSHLVPNTGDKMDAIDAKTLAANIIAGMCGRWNGIVIREKHKSFTSYAIIEVVMQNGFIVALINGEQFIQFDRSTRILQICHPENRKGMPAKRAIARALLPSQELADLVTQIVKDDGLGCRTWTRVTLPERNSLLPDSDTTGENFRDLWNELA